MELHSYAKLRGYKKWTIEQKRKLVEARINYDGIFSRKSHNCMESWKKIMSAAKLTEFNVNFVRKQWANLLARYKAYKRTRQRQLGKGGGELNDQMVREISEEWEFFYPIHSFMSGKTTNFHSYAQTPHASDGTNENGHNGENNGEHPSPAIPSKVKAESGQFVEMAIPPNTDHDFYSKSARREILDIKMEAEEVPSSATTAAASANNVVIGENCTVNSIKHPKQDEKVQSIDEVAVKKRKKRKLSERDKYYKHKRRYNRRNERRIDALLNIFGQVVKEHYPNVDTSRLEAQSDQVSTEDDDSSMSMYSVDPESTCTADAGSASDETGL